jgi:hypothetical protein
MDEVHCRIDPEAIAINRTGPWCEHPARKAKAIRKEWAADARLTQQVIGAD